MSLVTHLAILALAIAFGIAIKRSDKYSSTSPIMCSAILAIGLIATAFVLQHSTTLDKVFLIAYGLIAAFSFLFKFG